MNINNKDFGLPTLCPRICGPSMHPNELNLVDDVMIVQRDNSRTTLIQCSYNKIDIPNHYYAAHKCY